MGKLKFKSGRGFKSWQRAHCRIGPYTALQWVSLAPISQHTPPPGRNDASSVPSPSWKGPCGDGARRMPSTRDGKKSKKIKSCPMQLPGPMPFPSSAAASAAVPASSASSLASAAPASAHGSSAWEVRKNNKIHIWSLWKTTNNFFWIDSPHGGILLEKLEKSKFSPYSPKRKKYILKF